MKFDKIFKDYFQNRLIENKKNLELATLDVAQFCLKKNYLTVFDFFSNYNLETINNEILDSLNEKDNLKLRLRNNDWAVFRENEISFQNYKSLNSDKEHKSRRIARENLEYDCELKFWKDPAMNFKYREIANFDCFIDLDFEINDYNKIKNKGNYFNYIGWKEYVLKLVNENFPDFQLDKSKSKKILRFTKKLENGVSFGFEYDEKKMINEIKKGNLSLPDYFNLIIFNEDFNPKIDYKDYVFSYNLDILSLGILGNPFFFQPCFPVNSFTLIDLYHYGNSYPDNIEPKQVREYIKSDGKYRLVHSIEYGKKLKKHAFFYMFMLAITSKSYCSYIEKSIIETIKGVG